MVGTKTRLRDGRWEERDSPAGNGKIMCPGSRLGRCELAWIERQKAVAMTTSGEGLPNEPQGIERPLPSDGEGRWGSDVLAELLRALDIPYVALNPGASYRGLHDSLVNHLGNERPRMLLC